MASSYFQDGRTSIPVLHRVHTVPRPFVLVRQIDSSSMAMKIASRPTDAVRISTACLGTIENRPYTNSRCTQYTSRDVCPSCISGLKPTSPAPQRHQAYVTERIASSSPNRIKKKFGLVCQKS